MNGTEVALSLDDRREAIYEVMEDAAIDVGRHLIAAKAEHPGEFIAWVERELPFGIDKAERLMAITRSLGDVGPEIRAALPPAYSTLFHLSRLPPPRLREAVETGEVHPGSTYREAEALARSVNGNGVSAGAEHAERGRPVPMPEPEPSPVTDRTRIAAELVAEELMRFGADQLSDEMTRRLRTWLG